MNNSWYPSIFPEALDNDKATGIQFADYIVNTYNDQSAVFPSYIWTDPDIDSNTYIYLANGRVHIGTSKCPKSIKPLTQIVAQRKNRAFVCLKSTQLYGSRIGKKSRFRMEKKSRFRMEKKLRFRMLKMCAFVWVAQMKKGALFLPNSEMFHFQLMIRL